MNPLSLRALWKGLRGRSLTFSIVFALAVLGSSFGGLLRAPLRTIGLWAPLVLLLPIIATAFLARYEQRLKLEMRYRQWISYSLIFGSIALALLLWRYDQWLQSRYADTVQKGPLFKERMEPLKRLGPRGK